MNICFILDPWESLDPETDSSIRLVHECVLRGHRVGLTRPGSLTIRNSRSYAFAKVFKKSTRAGSNMTTFHRNAVFNEKMLPLSGFDSIFIRSNPPFDPIMLNFLDSVAHDTFIVNDIEGLRKANNKLYPAALDDPNNEIIPVTHVSKSIEFLTRTIEESQHERMILKPLDGYGGSGVIVLEKSARHNIKSLLDFYISGKKGNHYVILQDYVEGAEQGDTRVLMLNGRPIGAYRRVPAENELRSNIKVGGTAVKHTLTKKEKKVCDLIGPKLVQDGLYFVGLDIINGMLIEINVVSPGGIANVNRFNRTKVQKKVIDFIEDIVHAKESAIDRKREYKQLIHDL